MRNLTLILKTPFPLEHPDLDLYNFFVQVCNNNSVDTECAFISGSDWKIPTDCTHLSAYIKNSKVFKYTSMGC